MIGYIGYNAPFSVQMAINVGKTLYRAPFPMLAVKDYERAIRLPEMSGFGKPGWMTILQNP